MSNIFENDRPEGYDEQKDGEPRIRPEHLGKPEHLKMDAEDIEEFAEHYDQESDSLHGEQGAP